MQQTLIILKPDCMLKGLAGKVLQRFEEKGFRIVAAKLARLEHDKLGEHYAHLKDKPFFPSLLEFMKKSPVMLIVLEKKDAVSLAREMCGPTDSRKAPKGTIRGDYGEDVQTNVIHASDSVEAAGKEIGRFFKNAEIFG